MIFALAIAALPAAVLPSAALAEIAGRASVIDGDTVEVHGQRLEALAATKAGDCRMKGNVSSKGERWFCSEAEARAAGWRRSRR